jgi:hypothetical protein
LIIHSSKEELGGLTNSISTPVILSAPRPSLVAKLFGHILSNIRPRIPLKEVAVAVAVGFLVGDLVGDIPPTLVPFLAGLTPYPTLFLPI